MLKFQLLVSGIIFWELLRGIYSDPILIKSNHCNEYSIYSQNLISESQLSNNEIKICIKQPFFFGNKYCFTFSNFDDEELEFFRNNFK